MRISDWSSDVCSSDLAARLRQSCRSHPPQSSWARSAVAPSSGLFPIHPASATSHAHRSSHIAQNHCSAPHGRYSRAHHVAKPEKPFVRHSRVDPRPRGRPASAAIRRRPRSEEHTSELQSLMRISYAVFCLKKKKTNKIHSTLIIKTLLSTI